MLFRSMQVPSSMQVTSSKQVTEVVRQGDIMDTIQEVMEVDMVTESAVDSVWCQWRQDKENQTSDKSISGADYWANEILVSGAGVAGGQTQQHHLQGGVVADQQHQLPGHVGIGQSGHMKDIPGKPNIIPNLIVPLPGSSQQEEDGVTGDVREGHPGEVQHECDNSNGQGEVKVQQDVRGDRGATHVQQQHGVGAHGHREQQVGGHHDEDQEGDQVHGGVWDRAEGGGARRKVLGGRKSVLARVRDGCGNTPQKRRYWRRTSTVPDGLVQRRIDEFSVSVQNLVGGGTSAVTSQFDRKRKWLDSEAKDGTKLRDQPEIGPVLGTSGILNN